MLMTKENTGIRISLSSCFSAVGIVLVGGNRGKHGNQAAMASVCTTTTNKSVSLALVQTKWFY